MSHVSPVPSLRPFFVWLALFMGILAVTGFWETYFGPLVIGNPTSPAIIHFHAVVFMGWLVLFIAQVSLAATGHTRLHIRLGRFGIAYAVFLIFVGVLTGAIRARLPDGGTNARLWFAALADMAIFAGFFFTAIAYRRKPSIHRRAMVVAATMILLPAANRLWFLPESSTDAGFYLRLSIWFTPVLAAMAYDLWRGRGVHIIYMFGLIAFLLRRFLHQPIAQTDTWITFTENSVSFLGF